jgi:hypothetical protein
MKKAEFLTVLEEEGTLFERLINAVGVSRTEQPGVSGQYSVKDIVVHITAYERALVNWLKDAGAGKVYVDPVLDHPDVDARNSLVYEASKDRAASEVLADFHRTFDELVQCVGTFTEEELNDPESTAWFVFPRWKRKQALWSCIANDSYEHHHQHIPDIRRWLSETDTRSLLEIKSLT